MATVAVQSAKLLVSGPFQFMKNQRNTGLGPVASSSRSQQPPAFSDASTSQPAPESTKAFFRIRSSLEHSLRTATRSKKLAPSPDDELSTIAPRNSKRKEKASVAVEAPRKDKEKSSMLRRLESKVTFRRAGQESLTPSPLPSDSVASDPEDPVHKVRAAGFTSFVTPSMRQGSMSSPSLHLSSQALPSPKSRPAIPASSSSNSEVLVTPTRERTRHSSLHPPQRDISFPTPLGTQQKSPGDGHATPDTTQPPSRHRATKPPPLVSQFSTSISSTPSTRDEATSSSPSPEPSTPIRRNRDLPSPPDTPTPLSKSRSQLNRTSSRRAAASSGHLPLNTPDAGSSTPRTSSPVRIRSPTRGETPTQRGLTSISTSHLPLSRASPSPTPRRPSIDVQRRPSVDTARRTSVDSPRRPSVHATRRPSAETPRSPHESPTDDRGTSPSPRLRAVSPTQLAYAPNRHFNMSTLSLSGPPNPEYRELIRTATSMLCKEIARFPSHVKRSESGIKDWEEVEIRTQALVRSERTWVKNSGVSGGSAINLNSAGGTSSSEEKERRLFSEALRDGYVLCQLMNKLRPASMVRPDVREDGIKRTSNVTKFLAACSSYGLPEEDLFQHDDLIKATGDSLARVARTIIALLRFAEAPAVGRSKVMHGQGQKHSSPYSQSGASSRATVSTPNLIQTSSSVSPLPPSPVRKRYNPPSGLPTVRSDTPDSVQGIHIVENQDDDNGDNVLEVRAYPTPPLISPPPKSPLRARSVKRVDNGGLFTWAKNVASPRQAAGTDPPRLEIGDRSVTDSVVDTQMRQSVASSAMTETTMTTEVSSILDFSRSRSNSNGNKFGTIRTITTDATSEAPSITRTEGSVIAEELTWKRSVENGGKHHKDRKVSDGPVVDLLKVVEETDESASSSKGTKDKGKRKAAEQEKVVDRPRPPAINLRKGKWPDDFIDAFPAHSPTRAIALKSPLPDLQDDSYNSTHVSVSPPKKLAVVGASRRDESLENLIQLPRRPTHRPRHTTDPPALLPKEAVLGRDGGPDGIPAASGRIMLRRHSTKPSISNRNDVHFPPVGDGQSSDDSFVPFPQTALGGPGTSRLSEAPTLDDKPRAPRGRFRSDIDSSAWKRAQPSSYDELGLGSRRSRFESMVNLGVASSGASASDLLSRDSTDNSVLGKALILREDGKPSTHFQLGNCIGRGQFGSVYRALNLNTGQMVAVKRLRLNGLKEEEVMTLMKEVDLVKSLSHPSIVKYEGMARDKDTLSIVLEYAENGSLGQTLKAFGKLNERLVASYVVKILEGLHYLHQSDVVHCDLKAANILTTKNGNVKLTDFGVSLNLRAVEREKDVAGTPNWMAPEVIELKGASTKSDIWSLACTVIELLTGRPPYAEITNSMTVMFRIVEDDKPPIPEGCSQLLRDFLTKCFNKNPTERPSAELLCEHPWLKQNWGIHKELRPQDSIPFLRRVSADLQKSEVARYLSQIEMPESSPSKASTRADDMPSSSPPGHRASNTTIHPMADNEIAPREHSFVKTTFSKPMICRVCLLNVKKSAVLCAQCSLIAHSKCAMDAPPTCDLRAQLLLYAKYAEKGNPASVYSNPADGLRDLHPLSPASDVPYVAHSAGSIDTPSPSPLTPTPPTHPIAYKLLGALKRSRSNLSPEPTRPVLRKPREDKILPKKPVTVLNIRTNERPHSLTSNSTDLQSLRSAATAAESLSSRQDRRSLISSERGTRKSSSGRSAPGDSGVVEPSKMIFTSGVSEAVNDHDTEYDGLPGSLPVGTRWSRKRESKPGNCIVQ